eukprot:ctg_2773.g554
MGEPANRRLAKSDNKTLLQRPVPFFTCLARSEVGYRVQIPLSSARHGQNLSPPRAPSLATVDRHVVAGAARWRRSCRCPVHPIPPDDSLGASRLQVKWRRFPYLSLVPGVFGGGSMAPATGSYPQIVEEDVRRQPSSPRWCLTGCSAHGWSAPLPCPPSF